MNIFREINRHKFSKYIIFFIIVVIVIILGLAIYFQDRINQFRSIYSFQRYNNSELYVMHYYSDYGFDKFLQKGLQSDSNNVSQIISNSSIACTTFTALGNKDDLQFGRNYDWSQGEALLLFTDPPNGYASVSMVDISFLVPIVSNLSWKAKQNLLMAPYIPLDGMNEYGVAISVMYVPYMDGGNNPQKVTIGNMQAVRLVLDYARNIDEAIALLQKYNIAIAGGVPLHYLIADSTGRSIVVEFVNGEPKIIRNTEPFQVATNINLFGMTIEDARDSDARYRTAYDTLGQAGGIFTADESMALLEKVSQINTQWSVVYGITTGDFQIVIGMKYNQVFHFHLNLKNNK